MDADEIWTAVDRERASLATLFDSLTADQWSAPSLCSQWTVRDVAAHLSLAQVSPAAAAVDFVRARLSFDRMIRDSARRQARRPVEEYSARLRAMAGSRRKPPGTAPVDPLLDALVHGQDICVPLGIDRPMPPAAAAAGLDRVWTTGFPYFARRRLAGLRLVATDTEWAVGEGPEVRGSTPDLLLLVTGRRSTAVPRLAGPGCAHLAAPPGGPSGG